MHKRLLAGLTLSLALAGAAFTPAMAQVSSGAAPAAPAASGNAPSLSTGEPADNGAPKPGQTYVKTTQGDWEIRCIKTPDGKNEPCQMSQLLHDSAGTPTAELSVFNVDDPMIAGGASIVTPLETLLTRAVTVSINGAAAKRYPFNYCNQVGCISQIGFTKDEVAALKSGSTATVTIVPAASPDQTVDLTVSLKGFTAAFDSLPKRSLRQPGAAGGAAAPAPAPKP